MQPPENPYSGLPGPNDPVPASGTAPYHIPNSPRGPEISFDVISQAWSILQPNLGVYIGATVIIVLISGVFQGLQFAFTPRGSNGQQEFSAAPLIFGLIAGLVNQFLAAGMLRMAINHLRTGRPEFGQMFSVVDVIGNLILAGILMYLATVVGFCACIIPGLLLSGLFLFVNPLIVDRRIGAIEAMQTSFNTLKPQMWLALLFAIVIGLVASAGALACLVGVLVTVPLAVLSLAITYRNFFDSGGSFINPNPIYPTAPIADPRG